MRRRRYELAGLPAELRHRVVVNLMTGCWEWQHEDGPDPYRYGFIKWDGGNQAVYRVTYSLMVAAIPDGFVIDHVYARGCRAKSCCNPAHLEAVPGAVNVRRGARANIVAGVSQALRLRFATGATKEGDLPFARAIWELPLDYHPGHEPYVRKQAQYVTAPRAPVPPPPPRRAVHVVTYRPRCRASDWSCSFEETRWQTGMGKNFLLWARRTGVGPEWFTDEDGSFRYPLAGIEDWVNTGRVTPDYAQYEAAGKPQIRIRGVA